MNETTKATILLIHGAWQSRSVWDEVIKVIRLENPNVFALDLPGHGANSAEFSKIQLSTYVEYVTQFIDDKLPNQKVVLVGHSMAGLIISQIAEQRAISQLIYLCAFLPIHNESLIDLGRLSKIPGLGPYMKFNPEQSLISLKSEGLEKALYNDCSEACIQRAKSQLQDEPSLPFFEKVSFTSGNFAKTPKHYIECTLDQSVSLALQRYMYARWECTVSTLETGHAPYYSAPMLLAQQILAAI